jgi:uncharacterized protein (DUF983 family)
MTSRSNNKFRAIFMLLCPRCHGDTLYRYPSRKISHAFQMKTSCENCGQKFELEPGFYYGAMFLAYAITAILLFLTFAVSFFLLRLSVDISMAISIALVFLLYIYINRLSRSLWIHMNVKFDAARKES